MLLLASSPKTTYSVSCDIGLLAASTANRIEVRGSGMARGIVLSHKQKGTRPKAFKLVEQTKF